MTMISGLRVTKNINQDRRKVDMSDKIALLQPNKSPLILLTKKLATRPTINPQYSWLEDDLQGRTTKINNGTGYGASDTEFTVDDASIFNVGDIVLIPSSGETMRVTEVTNTSADKKIKVIRSYGTTAPTTSIADNTDLLIIGNAFKEGDTAAEATSVVTATKTNYTQIFRTSVKVSKTSEASDLFGGSDRAYQRRKKGIEHAVDIERSIWFGEASEHVSGADVIRTTGGVLSLLGNDCAIYDANNALTEANFEKEFMEQVFQYGSTRKTMFCGARVISVLNSWGTGKLQTVVGEETYGLAITRYLSAHGELNLIAHPLFGGVFGKMGVVLDLDNVAWRPLKGRDTHLNTNIQPNDADYYLDEYLTEGGFMLKLPQTHGIIKNVDFPSSS